MGNTLIGNHNKIKQANFENIKVIHDKIDF